MVKYRATCTLVWNFDSDLSQDESLEKAKQQIEGIPLQLGMMDPKMVVRLDKLKEKIQKVRLGEFELKDVIPYITKDNTKREYKFLEKTYAVKMNSHRYFLFRECIKCVACGLVGTKMMLEHHLADKSPHFNLYGVEDGKLVLMTKDHIHAKSCGGEDRHSNYQVMCIICNNLKGHANLTLDAIGKLRRLYDENKNKVTKKKLHLLVEDAKTKLAQPWGVKSARKRKKKVSSDAVITLYDINVWRTKAELVAKSVYDQVAKDHKHVACLRKGACLEPLITVQGKVMCKFSDSDVVIIPQLLLRQRNK